MFTTGCANQAAQDYYIAMQAAATANSVQQEARYRALATVAATGDENAAVAATMAIAMTQDKVVVPQYVESQSLKWAQVLATPVAAIAGIAIQADVAKNASDNATKVQLGSQNTTMGTILGLSQDQQNASVLTTQSVATLGMAGIEAVNVAGQQSALANQQNLEVVQATSLAGLNAQGTAYQNGLNAVTEVSQAGMQQITTVSNNGISATENTAIAGFNSTENIIKDYNQVILDNNTLLQSLIPAPVSP